MKQSSDEIALVTGGASGLGQRVSLLLVAQGVKVVVWDLHADRLAALEQQAPGRIIGMVCDVSQREQVYQRAQEVQDRVGPVTILINNAGVVSGTTFLDTPDAKIEQTLAINTLAHFWTVKAFLPAMIAQNHGRLVTIGSAAGIVGTPGLADYSASKFAAFGFHEAIRMELRNLHSAVKTTMVCPFYVNTGLFEGVKTRFPWLLPILDPDRVAQKIVRSLLKGRRRLVLPFFVYSVWLVRLMPVRLFDVLADFFGVNASMKSFKGRA